MNMLNFVFVPHGFTRSELETLFWQVNRAFYARARMAWKLASFLLSHPSHLGIVLRASLEFFGNTLRRRHGVIRGEQE